MIDEYDFESMPLGDLRKQLRKWGFPNTSGTREQIIKRLEKTPRGSKWKTKIRRIYLENFKAFQKSGTVELKPITFVVGKNSSGKSSILKAIAAMSQTVQEYRNLNFDTQNIMSKNPYGEHRLFPKGKYVDVGVFREIVNNKSKSNRYYKLGFTINASDLGILRLDKDLTKKRAEEIFEKWWVLYEYQEAGSSVESKLKRVSTGFIDENGNINEENTLFAMSSATPRRKWIVENLDLDRAKKLEIMFPLSHRHHFFFVQQGSFPGEEKSAKILKISETFKNYDEVHLFMRNGVEIAGNLMGPHGPFTKLPFFRKFKKNITEEQMDALKKILEKEKLKMKIDQYIQMLVWRALLRKFTEDVDPLTRISMGLERALGDRVNYLGPIRDEPHREVHDYLSQVDDIGTKGEKTAAAIHASNKKTRELLDYSVHKLGLGDGITTKPLVTESGEKTGFLQLYLSQKDGHKYLLIDLGFGISQVLPIMFTACIEKDTMILLEQPELHLHPSLQSELTEVLFDSCDRGNQFIIESHSVNMIERVRRRIREGKLNHQSVNVIYVGKDDDGAYAQSIGFDKKGGFTESWPDGDGFFGEREKEKYSGYFRR